MKKAWLVICDNAIQVIDIIIMIVVLVGPHIINIQALFEDFLKEEYASLDNFVVYFALTKGNFAISLLLLVLVIIGFRKTNKERLMNKGNVYHDYPYLWYWISAKFFGIKKCNLELLPISTQFKLVINSVFDEYPFAEGKYQVLEDEKEIKVFKEGKIGQAQEINIILEDTYLIQDYQIPEAKRELPTIRISRNNGYDFARYNSPKFVNEIISEIHLLKKPKIINIFATTNPMNTKNIAEGAFKNADRGNVLGLYVYQQDKSEKRLFNKKGNKIY